MSQKYKAQHMSSVTVLEGTLRPNLLQINFLLKANIFLATSRTKINNSSFY